MPISKIANLKKLYKRAQKKATTAECQLRAAIKAEFLELYGKNIEKSTNSITLFEKHIITPLKCIVDDEGGEGIYSSISLHGFHDDNYGSIGFEGAPIPWLLNTLAQVKKIKK